MRSRRSAASSTTAADKTPAAPAGGDARDEAASATTQAEPRVLDGSLSRWRVPVAAVVMMGLTALVAWQLTGPAPAPSPVPPLTGESPAADVGEEVEGEGSAEVQAVMAARAAVEAWGTFATSGELEGLDPYFDPTGPQHEHLAGEVAERIADPATYELVLTPLDVHANGAAWLVDGTVHMRRNGQPAGAWQWRLELRQHPGHGWRVWTVTEINQR
jgi:hypothetical protein